MLSRMMYKPHISCLQKDIVTQNGITLTTDSEINKILLNGAEVYCIDTSKCYLYDEENKTLIEKSEINDILVDGEITPESVTLINNKVNNFIAEINNKIAQADIDKVVELANKMDVLTDDISEINSSLNAMAQDINNINNSKQDKIEDSGWILLTLSSELNSSGCYVKKEGNEISFKGSFAGVTKNLQNVFTLPTGFINRSLIILVRTQSGVGELIGSNDGVFKYYGLCGSNAVISSNINVELNGVSYSL